MSRTVIVVDPNRSNKQLTMVSVGRMNSLELVLKGMPSDVYSVQIHFQDRIDSPYLTYLTEPLANGEWFVNLPGIAFKSVGDVLYHITALNDDGRGTWFGSGKCRVMPSVMNVPEGGDIPQTQDTIYVRNRVTNLYHKIEIDMDENGNPFPVISSEGIAR